MRKFLCVLALSVTTVLLAPPGETGSDDNCEQVAFPICLQGKIEREHGGFTFRMDTDDVIMELLFRNETIKSKLDHAMLNASSVQATVCDHCQSSEDRLSTVINRFRATDIQIVR